MPPSPRLESDPRTVHAADIWILDMEVHSSAAYHPKHAMRSLRILEHGTANRGVAVYDQFANLLAATADLAPRLRMRRMKQIVRERNIYRWAGLLPEELGRLSVDRIGVTGT